jgi:hypothetical protein
LIADGQGVATIRDDDATKFYVVNDATADRTYEYADPGNSIENYALGTGNTAPRGAASNVAGDQVWVADVNRKVYVYNTSGGSLGSWTAGTLQSTAQVEGITTNGTDVWIVDNKTDKVFRYTAAASRTTGSQNAASSFSLNGSNKSPKDIVTDGTYLWVVNDSTTDKVFKYTLTGTLIASWTISTPGATSPTGITLNPASPSQLWIVDSGTDRVYDYSNAVNQANGSSSSAVASFALAAGNTNPQGIADPPPQGSVLPAGTSTFAGPGSGSSAFVPRVVASIFSSSATKTVISELSVQDDSIRGVVTESKDLVDSNRSFSKLGQSKGISTKQLNSALRQMDQIVTSDITAAADLDDLFADWSTDPLQLSCGP